MVFLYIIFTARVCMLALILLCNFVLNYAFISSVQILFHIANLKKLTIYVFLYKIAIDFLLKY